MSDHQADADALTPVDAANRRWNHAGAEGWTMPKPLGDGALRPAFPIEAAFPPALALVRDFVSATAEAIQVADDLPAMILPPVAAVALAQKVEVAPNDEWREPSALFTLPLAESGERKSEVFRRMMAPLVGWERDEAYRLGPEIARQQERRRIDEKRLETLRREAASGDGNAGAEAEALAQRLAAEVLLSEPRLVTSEPTPEALAALMSANMERAIVAAPEGDAIDVLLGRYSDRGAPNLGIYLAGHAREAVRIDRRSRPSIRLDHPTLSVAMIVQAEAVRGLFASRTARGRGLINRFLAVYPTSRLGSRAIDAAPVPERLTVTYMGAIRWMLDLPIDPGRGPTIVRLDPEARALFDDFRRQVEPELAPTGDLADRAGWGSKLPGAIARIALVLHGLAAAHLRDEAALAAPITGETMRAALAWAPYLITHQRIVEGLVGCDPATATASRVLGWLARTGAESFTKRDAFTAVRGGEVRHAEDVDEPLGLLRELDYIRPYEPVRPGSQGGRTPSPAFHINPLWDRSVGL